VGYFRGFLIEEGAFAGAFGVGLVVNIIRFWGSEGGEEEKKRLDIFLYGNVLSLHAASRNHL
ncbi:MAG TPA: hypothetical protein VKG84_08760, partial [Candidatus Acidoferrales bacterium]|nr:hypothetical protein [Candidatus Acidoferrales bacterium]